MKFKATEGHLLSTLPKDKGSEATVVPDPELHDIRVSICADRLDQPLGAKETHQQDLLGLKKSGKAVGDVVVVQVELGPQRYPLYRTQGCQPPSAMN